MTKSQGGMDTGASGLGNPVLPLTLHSKGQTLNFYPVNSAPKRQGVQICHITAAVLFYSEGKYDHLNIKEFIDRNSEAGDETYYLLCNEKAILFLYFTVLAHMGA